MIDINLSEFHNIADHKYPTKFLHFGSEKIEVSNSEKKAYMEAVVDIKSKISSWIDVNKKLPKENQEVLICNRLTGMMNKSVFSKWNKAYGHEEKQSWFWKNTSSQFATKSITHWLPLPNFPKK